MRRILIGGIWAMGMALALGAPAPRGLTLGDLQGVEQLEPARLRLVRLGLEAIAEVGGKPYVYGGNGKADGGFDCSGAMYFILRKAGLNPPRASLGQFEWVSRGSKLHRVAADAVSLEHPDFSALKPGDLLFWSGTYEAKEGATVPSISHVAMFLGYEKKDSHPIMLNSSDGRTYRGEKLSGFGVFDFKIPPARHPAKLVGYGTPPGLRIALPSVPLKTRKP